MTRMGVPMWGIDREGRARQIGAGRNLAALHDARVRDHRGHEHDARESAQMTTVSQKVPVMDTMPAPGCAWRPPRPRWAPSPADSVREQAARAAELQRHHRP